MRYRNQCYYKQVSVAFTNRRKKVDLLKNNAIKSNTDWNTAIDPERRVHVNIMAGR